MMTPTRTSPTMNRPRFPLALIALLAAALTASPTAAVAADAGLAAALRAKGAEVTEASGEIVGVTFKDNTGLTAADYALLQQIPHLKTLGCGIGLDDAALKALAGLPALELLSTNGMKGSDEGVAALASIKTLQNIAFFHPGKGFTGIGLAALASLPKLERLTVAGSNEFGDAGMAAAAKLTHLTEFRTWHNGVTLEGVKKLSALGNLRSINLGQRLSSTPPATLTDEALPVLAGIKSLEVISISETRLSLPALQAFKQLPKLKRLTLDGIDISEADVAALRQQLPQVDVKWNAPTDAFKKRIQSLFPPAKP